MTTNHTYQFAADRSLTDLNDLALADAPTGQVAPLVPEAPEAPADNKPSKSDAEDVAQALAFQCKDDVAYNKATHQWLIWVGTHWQEQDADSVDLHAIAVEVLTTLKARRNSNIINDAWKFARRHLAREFQPAQRGLINFQDGTLDIYAGNTLHTHERADDLTYCLPYNWQPTPASTPLDNWLEATIPDPAGLTCYLAHIGLALLGDTSVHKAVMIYGQKRGGKSLLMAFANGVQGAANEDEAFGFAGAELFLDSSDGLKARATWNNHRLVCIDELEPTALRGEGKFKNMTAHSGVTMRQMYERESTSNRWRTKLLMAANDRPSFTDTSGAIAGRLVLVHVPVSHYGREDLTLIGKLWPHVPALAGRCIDAALQVLATGQYPASVAMLELAHEIAVAGDPVKGWLEDNCKVAPSLWAGTEELYADFKAYCERAGSKLVGEGKLVSRLKDMGLGITGTRKRMAKQGAKQVSILMGLALAGEGVDDTPDND